MIIYTPALLLSGVVLFCQGGLVPFLPTVSPAVVVGRVIEDDMAFLDEIHAIPTRRDIISIGDVPPLGGNFARACDFTSPDKTCAQFKPLKKIMVVTSSVAAFENILEVKQEDT